VILTTKVVLEVAIAGVRESSALVQSDGNGFAF
jgi:hypothetical protein